MLFPSVAFLTLLPAVLALPGHSGRPSHDSRKPAVFFLAGDSTTAVQSTGGGGWGNGFLNWTLKAPAFGVNFGHNGATTVSFRAGGDWARVLGNVSQYKDSNEVFVTIQFGHNDQKPAANISLAEYAANLAQMASDVKAAGGTPPLTVNSIMVTPLTRRNFAGNPPRVIESLSNETALTLEVAKNNSLRFINLNQASEAYVNAIGPNASYVYNLTPTDYTHLNYWGSIVFGRIVSDLMQKYEDIREWTKPNATLSREIAAGVPA